MRLFLAIDPGQYLRSEIHNATAPLREVAPELNWVAEPLLHLTLKFLGDPQPELVPAISEALAQVAGRHREMEVGVAGVGAFPTFRRARVLWMGVERDPRLELLHHDVEVAFESLGFPVEGRPFNPHLTLARVRERIAPEVIRKLAREAARVDFHGDLCVSAIHLMSSEVSPTGRHYTALASASLRNP